jgi:hypothetical protein
MTIALCSANHLGSKLLEDDFACLECLVTFCPEVVEYYLGHILIKQIWILCRYEYRWADGVQIKKPIEVSAPKYVEASRALFRCSGVTEEGTAAMTTGTSAPTIPRPSCRRWKIPLGLLAIFPQDIEKIWVGRHRRPNSGSRHPIGPRCSRGPGQGHSPWVGGHGLWIFPCKNKSVKF